MALKRRVSAIDIHLVDSVMMVTLANVRKVKHIAVLIITRRPLTATRLRVASSRTPPRHQRSFKIISVEKKVESNIVLRLGDARSMISRVTPRISRLLPVPVTNNYPATARRLPLASRRIIYPDSRREKLFEIKKALISMRVHPNIVRRAAS